MSLLFPYRRGRSRQPVISLDGRLDRPRPLVDVSVVGPVRSVVLTAILDSGADDAVFPERVAALAGIDLSQAQMRTSAGVAGARCVVRYVKTVLRLSDGREHRQWLAWAGFTAATMIHPVLGFADCLQFFTATFHGDCEEAELTVNSTYAGT